MNKTFEILGVAARAPFIGGFARIGDRFHLLRRNSSNELFSFLDLGLGDQHTNAPERDGVVPPHSRVVLVLHEGSDAGGAKRRLRCIGGVHIEVALNLYEVFPLWG